MRSVERAPAASILILLVGALSVGGILGAPRRVQAQSTVRALSGQTAIPSSTRLGASEEDHDPQAGRILLGSALGAVGGAGLGAALLLGAKAAREENDGRYDDPNRTDPTIGLSMIGVAFIVGGAPFGAVRMGGIERGRTGAYVVGGVGEFVVGGAGYTLANQIHESPTSRYVGLGVGWILGAAGGALLAAPQQKSGTGLVGYRDGEWQVSRPALQVRSSPILDRPSVGVTLLSVRLQ